MSKRRNENSNGSAQAAKKMFVGKQNDSNVSTPSEEKFYRYHQTHSINFASSYLAEQFADVHFVFQSDDGTVTRIPAHKVLLIAASDVFEKMFCGELKENGDVKIVDASAAAFKEFLQFFYLNEVKVVAKHVDGVLYLGNKYNVKNCVDACLKFFTNNLSAEIVCTALSLGILHDQMELKRACEKQIISDTADVFKSPEFLQCDKAALAHILKLNLLTCSEAAVFEACMDWVRAKSKQQVLSKALVEEHLGDSYYQIRLASMTSKEVCALDTKYSTVLGSDFREIVRLIDREDVHSERFNTSPRQIEWNWETDVCSECCLDDGDKEMGPQALDRGAETIFSASEPLLLGGFKCNAIDSGESNLLTEVEITETRKSDGANTKVLLNMTTHVGSKGDDGDGARIELPQPIVIWPDFFYTITMNGFLPGHCFDKFEPESSTTLKSGAKIELHNDKVDEGKSFGLIWTLFFNAISERSE